MACYQRITSALKICSARRTGGWIITGVMRHCSFCGEARNRQDLLSSRLKRSTKICSDCVKLCRDVMNGTYMRQKSGVYRLVVTQRLPVFQRCCSFCGDPMTLVERMFRSRIDYERYICSRCVSDNEHLP